jgi:hypothetical protein
MRIAWLVLLVACQGKGQRPDGGTGLDGQVVLNDGSGIDGPFACADDSALEPNDTVANAFVTNVDAQPMIALTGLAICPPTDKDHYRITLSTTKALEVIASWDSGPALNVALLNAGGTSISNGVAGTNQTRACVPSLPVGSYFASVFGTMQNNYRLSIKALASCP